MSATDTVKEVKTQTPMRTGIIMFLISEAFLFGALFWTYYYLRGNTPGWPPEHPDATLASINTFFLLSSSATLWWARRAVRQGKEKQLSWGLAITFVLGIAFLGITLFEWTHEAFRPWTNAYGSIFYTLTGFHALHVLGGVILLAALFTRALKHRYSSRNFLGVEMGSYYWHFVDFIWLFVFSSIFIVR